MRSRAERGLNITRFESLAHCYYLMGADQNESNADGATVPHLSEENTSVRTTLKAETRDVAPVAAAYSVFLLRQGCERTDLLGADRYGSRDSQKEANFPQN
jgi:hypothetical protein